MMSKTDTITPAGDLTKHLPNILSIDVEDYFMVSAFEKVVKREEWERHDSRIEPNVDRILEILEALTLPSADSIEKTREPIKATFFCLGWIGQRYPQVIRRIHGQGHEIASHGFDHRLVYEMSPDQFREDARKAKGILEDIISEEIFGYRAPSYSITEKSLWALEILGEEGYRYDSSIFPIHHDRYGISWAPRFPFLVGKNSQGLEFLPLIREPQGVGFGSFCRGPFKISPPAGLSEVLVEFPLSTVRALGQNIPIAGGGYFRFFPYPLLKRGLQRVNRRDCQPFVFYLHPWELDPGQPRIDGLSPLASYRHYKNLGRTKGRLESLIQEFEFCSFRSFWNRLPLFKGEG